MMTMREELIAAAAKAMAELKHPGFVRMGGVLEKHIAAETAAATAALDAILAGLNDPSEEMVQALRRSILREYGIDQQSNGRLIRHVQAMLKPLKGE